MLSLVARHADAWNSAWHATPELAAATLDGLRHACEEAGRDPASVALTISVPVAYPDLGLAGGRSRYLSGSPQQIAEALRGLAALGPAHVMVELWPYMAEALNRFAEAVQVYRSAA